MNHAPWTDLGSIQSDIRSLQNELRNKLDNHEIYPIISRLASLEYSVGELSTTLNEILFRLQKLEEGQLTL